jgi:hypothetical protein
LLQILENKPPPPPTFFNKNSPQLSLLLEFAISFIFVCNSLRRRRRQHAVAVFQKSENLLKLDVEA